MEFMYIIFALDGYGMMAMDVDMFSEEWMWYHFYVFKTTNPS